MADDIRKRDERRIEQEQIKAAVGETEDEGIPDIPKDAARDVSRSGMPIPSPMTRTINDPSMRIYPSQMEEKAGMMEISEQMPPRGYEDMEPSMLEQNETTEEQFGSENYPAGYGIDPYAQYQSYQETMSSDVITEISEQVVSERLTELQDKLERALDFRTVADARLSSLNERLTRIEKIMDRLQLSLLQKVGEYVNDVSDLKQEVRETQKSFKALLPGMRKTESGENRGKATP